VAVSLLRPLGLLALLAAVVAVLVWRRLPPPLSRRGARVALGVRLALLLAVSLALAGLQVGHSPSAQTLLAVVDRSASLESGLTGEREQVLGLQNTLRADDRFGVVTFGHDAAVEVPAEQGAGFTDFGTRPNANYTDIESALRLAGSVLPGDTRRHVVLISDGRQNSGDALPQVRLLRQEGVRVDVLAVDVPAGPEVRIDGVRAPATVAPQSRPHVQVSIVSNVATTGTLHVDVDRTGVADIAQVIPAGQTDVDIALPALGPGLHTVHASLDPALDTLSENNVGEALVQVLGTQRVLVVDGHPGAAANVAAALRAAGVDVAEVDPTQVPHDVPGVAAYQSVALVDVSASSLGQDRMLALQQATRDLGVGLAALGGPDTFGPGGFAGTPLEQALPIDMQVQNQSAKPPVAVVLVLESVESSQGDAVVRGAARSLVDKLTPRDMVGVTDATTGLAVPLQKVTDRARVENAILSIPAFGDPPSYEPYLQDAEQALVSHPEATRHIILLGDGDSMTTSPSLIADIVKHGITVSTVGVDVHSSAQGMAAMRDIATQGKGRFYQSESPAQVPDILLQETDKSLKPWIVERNFAPSLGAPSAVLAGVDVAHFPGLGGYVASTAKAAAEVALRGPERDPILAQWQYGLGRAVAWTSDAEGRWTGDLLRWPQAGRLLAQLVTSTLPLTPDPALDVSTSIEGDHAHVIAALSKAPDDASLTVDAVAPDGTAQEVLLAATAPGRWEGDVAATSVGSYLLRVSASSRGTVVHAVTTGVAVPYSPEYRFVGTDKAFLAELAAAGGGVVLRSAADVASAVAPAVTENVDLSPWLLMLAALLLPLDVAVRRLAFRPGDAAVWAQLAQRREGAQAAPDPGLERLRARVARVRAERGAPGSGTETATREAEQPAGASLPDERRRAAPPDEGDLAARLLERRRRR